MKAQLNATSEEAGDDADADGPVAHRDDVATFLSALATLLRDTVTRLEETVGHITGRVAAQPLLADRDMIVTLQDFDRLQQEFAALGDVLSGYAATKGDPARAQDSHSALLRELVAAVSVHDFQQRLIGHLSESRESDDDEVKVF